MTERCKKCSRPVWGGGYATSSRECDWPDGDMCKAVGRALTAEELRTCVAQFARFRAGEAANIDHAEREVGAAIADLLAATQGEP